MNKTGGSPLLNYKKKKEDLNQRKLIISDDEVTLKVYKADHKKIK